MEYSDNELKLIKDLSVSNSMLLRANPPKIDEFYKNIGDGKTDERYDRAIITGFLQYEMGIDPLKYVHTLYTGMFDIKTKIFYNGEANKIKIPDSIKKIEMGAFDKCLYRVILPTKNILNNSKGELDLSAFVGSYIGTPATVINTGSKNQSVYSLSDTKALVGIEIPDNASYNNIPMITSSYGPIKIIVSESMKEKLKSREIAMPWDKIFIAVKKA